jgi:hypothetical protein
MNATMAYEAPTVQLDHLDPDDIHPVAIWIVVCVLFAVALVYASYCRATGGWPDIRLGWGGFRVACNR